MRSKRTGLDAEVIDDLRAHESKREAIRAANTPNKRGGIGKTIVQAVLETCRNMSRRNARQGHRAKGDQVATPVDGPERTCVSRPSDPRNEYL